MLETLNEPPRDSSVHELVEGWDKGGAPHKQPPAPALPVLEPKFLPAPVRAAAIEDAFGPELAADAAEETRSTELDAALKESILAGLRKELTRLDDDAWQFHGSPFGGPT